MNYQAVVALIGDLYTQVATLGAELAAAQEEIATLKKIATPKAEKAPTEKP